MFFYGRNLSRYSEKKIRLKKQGFNFPKITKKHTKNTVFKGKFKYKEAVCFTRYSL